MIGRNTFTGSQDIPVYRKPEQDSWGDTKHVYHHTLEMVGLAPRTTTAASNDSFRERVASGYTMYLDADQVASIKAGDEFHVPMPDGTIGIYQIDGYKWGLAWDQNPLSSFNAGNEVNLTFLRAEAI